MMRLSLIIAALMVTSCAGAKSMVRTKTRSAPRIAPEDKTQTTGFSDAEDLPTLAEKGKVNPALEKSTVKKAGANGPSFNSEDSNGEHPNIVDKMSYDTNTLIEQGESSSSLPMFLFLACGAGVVAWMYASEAQRSQAKDKANTVKQMLGPLVQEAGGVLGIAMQGAAAASAAVRHSSIHTRFMQQSSYQRVSCDDHDDLMAENDEGELDDQCNVAAGIEESFFDNDLTEEVPQLMEASVPQLMEVAPPLDLFDDSASAAPPLDVFASDLSSPPSLLDFGLPAQTLGSDNNAFDM